MGSPSIWFTADLHFGHAKIINHCRRPWSSVEEMDRGLIERWNAWVRPGDEVYVLGDFSFHDLHETGGILGSLHGNIHMVWGNHDKALRRWNGHGFVPFAGTSDLLRRKFRINGRAQQIVLCHYPLQVWDLAHLGAWHLHGHSHGTLPAPSELARMDVGVDANYYKPVHLNDVAHLLSGRTWVPIDHHGAQGPARAQEPTTND